MNNSNYNFKCITKSWFVFWFNKQNNKCLFIIFIKLSIKMYERISYTYPKASFCMCLISKLAYKSVHGPKAPKKNRK